MSQNKQTNRFHNWKNTKFAGMAVTLSILVLVIAVVLNMIVSRLDFSWDISPNKQYSLSSTTEKYLDQRGKNGRLLHSDHQGKSGKRYEFPHPLSGTGSL